MLVLLPPPPPRRRLRFAHLAGLAFFLLATGVLVAAELEDPVAIDGGRGGGGYFGWGTGSAIDPGKGGADSPLLEGSAADGGGRRSSGYAKSFLGVPGAADLPSTNKDRGLMMKKCKKKGKAKKCRRPARRPTPRPTGECSAGVTVCGQGFVQCRATCACARSVEGAALCVDPSRSTTFCENICASSAECTVGEVCISSSSSCCDGSTCTPLCLQ